MRAWISAAVLLLGCRPPEPTVAPPGPEPAEVSQTSIPAPATTEPEAASAGEGTLDAAGARAEYDRALLVAHTAEAGCEEDPAMVKLDGLVEAYEILAPYERSAERDSAITALERCRQLVSAYILQTLPEVEQAAADYTAELEDEVRRANARTTKRLSITIKGSKVTIEKRDGVGGKKEEKRALEGYCAKASASGVTRITVVTDEHGEMSCSPQFKFSKQSGYVDRRMGIATPFEFESTEGRKTPPAKK